MINYELKETLLKVEYVSFSYDEGKKVLHSINFEVRDIIRPGITTGERIGILGKSGGGKSTLFKLLSGFTKPDTGSIKIGANQHSVLPGEVGVVPQDYPLLNHRTIRKNLEIALRGADKVSVIKEYSEYFGISAELDKFPLQLSGGQRQRACILQQILAQNSLILLDEPFSGLDYVAKDRVTDLLIKTSDISEENTLVIVSHDIESVCAIADHIYVIGSDGKNDGSTIIKSYDLLEMDLAYHPDIKEMKLFRDVVKEIKSIM